MDGYYMKLAAAYVRGEAQRGQCAAPAGTAAEPLDALDAQVCAQLIASGEAAGLRMYHFKKKALLPRVKAVMGFLRGVQPQRLLDVGSGRGAFLLPFLEEFGAAQVTALDLLPHRVRMLQSIAAGGVGNLTALQQDICGYDAPAGAFDVVTLLEVLEHIPDVQAAVSNAVRLAGRYVVASVPSKPDNNPEHIHLLTKDALTELFAAAGCTRLHVSGVNGHLILTARVEQS